MSRTDRSVEHKTRRKKGKKRNGLFWFLFFLIIFALGFLAGLWVGVNQDPEISFVMSADMEETEKLPWYITERESDLDLPWNLTLVNYENALPEDFAPEELAVADNGYEVDARIADAAKEMIAAARKENVKIIALSAFRDYEYQLDLYNNKVKRLQQQKGYSVAKAREEAATVVAYPGTSEHQLGLALDLVDAKHVELDESQENTAAYQWLVKHCHEFGFIVRYPNGKTDITGIIYEPWHFRYVGVEAATYIMEQGICLEEYLWETYQ